MSYFEGQGANWPQHRPHQSWDPSHAHSRPGSGTLPHFDEVPMAFDFQFEEIARASDNLTKGAKSFLMPNKREPMSIFGAFARQFPEIESRAPTLPRPQSSYEYDGLRSHSSNSPSGLQGYLSNQRFGSRPSEAEQMLQAKRRAAAQRERELRNYHQAQQYNRSTSAVKTDRAMSPSGMNEEDRRELIARQHRALYGNDSSLYLGEAPSSRPASQDARVAAGHGAGPVSFESFKMASGSIEGALTNSGDVQSHDKSTASPPPNTAQFSMFDNSQQTARPLSSSPNESPPHTGVKIGAVSIGPIGSRPQGTGLHRGGPPMPSNYGYSYHHEKMNASTERSASAASNPASGKNESGHGLGWGSSSGPWGAPKNTLGLQAPVWG